MQAIKLNIARPSRLSQLGLNPLGPLGLHAIFFVFGLIFFISSRIQKKLGVPNELHLSQLGKR